MTRRGPALKELYVQALCGARLDADQPLAPQIYALLRAAVIQDRLPPGSPIYEARLAQILGVSRTPLRTALQQLAQEELIETRPQVGSRVAPIERRKVLAAVFCRNALETAVARRLAEAGPLEAALFARNLELQAECAARDDRIAFFEHDEAFHALLAERAGVPEAWRLVLAAKIHADRARLRLQSAIPGRAVKAYQEHLRILEAIGAGDPDLAAAVMEAHVASALDPPPEA